MTDYNAGGVTQLNNTIDDWITFLDVYTFEMLCRQPRPGSWSLGQVYVHIITDTPWFIQQAKASTLTKKNSEGQMHPNARTMFANNAFPDMQIEGPLSNQRVQQPHSKDELLHGLVNIKDGLNRLFGFVELSASTGKTKHPGLGYFNAAEWLQLAEMHMRHHLRQKKRIDEKILNV